MFSQSANLVITGGEFVSHNCHTTSAFKELQKASAPSALFDSSARFDSPKCYPNTRIAVLEYIMGWIFGRNDPDALILWLYGPAGVGKSAILQTIAEMCSERGTLLASFFFGRSDSTRNSFKPLIPTIACQIAIMIPEIRPLVESVIERDPFIFDKSIATQLQSLVIQPLKGLIAPGFLNNLKILPRLILIDGLDECNDTKMQSMILQVLGDSLQSYSVPLIFLIASRPELNIIHTFNSTPLLGHWRSFVLDYSCMPDKDVHYYLVESFKDIRLTHPHREVIPDNWPSPSDLEHLVGKSSGYFIYASVVIKYISASHGRPPHRLDIVKGLCPALHDIPFSELDTLYMHILASCPNSEKLLTALGVLVAGITQKDSIELILDLLPGDLNVLLRPLNSIIRISNDYIHLRHASFSDFLLDKNRSLKYHIDVQEVKETILWAFVTKSMDPDSVVTNGYCETLIYFCLDNIQLTDKIKAALMKLYLPRVWKSWASKLESAPLNLTWRSPAAFIFDILNKISPQQYSNTAASMYPEEFEVMHKWHFSSFEPTLRSEFEKHYEGTELVHLVNISDLFKSFWSGYKDTDVERMIAQPLLQISDESILLDANMFEIAPFIGGGSHFQTNYTNTWSELSSRVATATCHETVIRILKFLCTDAPSTIQYNKHNSMSLKTLECNAAAKPSDYLSVHKGRRKIQISRLHPRYPRLRRERRHRLGVPEVDDIRRPTITCPYVPCRLGLEVLPKLLKHAQESTELVNLMRTCGKRITFIPRYTRKAIRAMHDYLIRVEEDAELMDLRDRFSIATHKHARVVCSM